MDGGAQNPFAREIQELNLQFLNILKLAVVANDRVAIESFGLRDGDVEFIRDASTSDLRRLAANDRALVGLRFAPNALRNALVCSSKSNANLVHAILASAPQRQPEGVSM